jgi:hypothetical protein
MEYRFLLLTALLLPSASWGADGQQSTIDSERISIQDQKAAHEKQVSSLVGIKALSIMIASDTTLEPLHPHLTEAQIRTDVELRLRKAGVSVVGIENPHHATVVIDVNALRSTDGLCVFDFSVEIWQSATVDRNNQKFSATTWGPKGYLGLDSKIRGAAETIRKELGDYIDEFLNDYLTANPLRREVQQQP